MARACLDRSLIVPVAALERSPGGRLVVRTTVPARGLGAGSVAVPDGFPLEVDLVVEAVHGGVLVSGSVHARWHGECRRCLEEAEGEIACELRELYVPQRPSKDETTYPIDGDEVDLGLVVHDACILDLPLAPVCFEGCRGLCPECGANRNLEPCAHVGGPGRLVVLDGGRPDGT